MSTAENELILATIANGFTSDVTTLYRVFSDAIATAENNPDKIQEAKTRFSIGLKIASETYNSALTLVNVV